MIQAESRSFWKGVLRRIVGGSYQTRIGWRDQLNEAFLTYYVGRYKVLIAM